MQTNALVKMYLDEHAEIIKKIPIDNIADLLDEIRIVYDNGGRVFCFGNGGGASIADHFASDLSIHPFVSEDKHKPMLGRRLEVICLNISMSIITRIANDISYNDIFAEQLKSYDIDTSDIVIAFSTSGNSPNILKAMEYANKMHAITALIGGRNGGKCKALADVKILIPGTSRFPGQVGTNDNCFHIEDFQTSVAHIITGLLKGGIK